MHAPPDTASVIAARGRTSTRLAGLGLTLAGVLLLVAVALYYTYSLYAGSKLEDLNVSEAEVAQAVVDKAPQVESTVFEPILLSEPSTSPTQPDRSVFPASVYETVYPGFQIHPKYWDQPLWAGPDPYPHVVTGLPPGFISVASDSSISPAGFGATTRIGIPIIGVDSSVSELEIVDLGDSQAYENPDNIVGHIPETAAPGELGNGWFFGHLESPLRGEGNVFRRLPDIPEYLRDGDPVYVTLESDVGVHLYRVTATKVVHEDDLRLYDADNVTITLVACVPRLVYDHRLLVTAELVGVSN